MDEIISVLSSLFHWDQSSILFYIILASMGSRALGNYIPESATGVVGMVRKLAKVFGLYVANRITPGVSTSDVASALIASNVQIRSDNKFTTLAAKLNEK
jgi:hypothetical protein